MNVLTQTIIITGANRGLGYALTNELLSQTIKPTIIFTSRDESLGKLALEKLLKTHPDATNNLVYHKLEVTSQESINVFKDFIVNKYQTFDVLVNNAGIANRRDTEEIDYVLPQEEIRLMLETNFYSVIRLTETLLPYLSPEGKIVNISSNFGQLLHQGERVAKLLSQKMTREELFNEAKQFLDKASQNKHQELGYSKPTYKVTKALLNAYTRWILPGLLKESQSCFACHPGWCKTRMGGPNAEITAEQGTKCALRVIQRDFVESKKLSGLYFDEHGEPDEF